MSICDCKNKVENKLREATGDSDGVLDGLFILNKQSNQFLHYPSINFNYRKKNKKGEFNKKQSIMSVKCSFCPFCGKNLNSLEEQNNANTN